MSETTVQPSGWSNLATPQSATLRLKFGQSVEFETQVDVTPAGLLAIGALVSSILLSVAPIILAAGQAKAKARTARLGARR